MHPFHRLQQHKNSRPRARSQNGGRVSKTQKNEDILPDTSDVGTNVDQGNSSRCPEAESIIRAKEQVLLQSLSQSHGYNHLQDNTERLGPNRIDTFQGLRDVNETKQETETDSNKCVLPETSVDQDCCDRSTRGGVEVDTINNNSSLSRGGSIPKLIVSSPELDILEIEEELTEVDEIPAGLSAITLTTAIHLKKLMLGSSSLGFSPQWMGQGFVFNKHPNMGYGLMQKAGGPCGVLSTIQGFILKNLLFERGVCNSVEPLRPTRKECLKALLMSLTDVLWQAGDCKRAVLAIPSSVTHLPECGRYRHDGLIENLELFKIESRSVLEDSLMDNLDHFTGERCNGCLLLAISAILSRGIQGVREDMDDPVPLIAPNGHCVQELVNLLLTGRAVANVFDNNVYLDTCLLRGVSSRAEVGFLSLFEHYNSCQVGTYLKTPRYPVWIVCSENHFTVLFSCKKELISDWRAEKRFHLYHYDCLGRQLDEVKLTVDTTGMFPVKTKERDRVHPLEHCIRTKWNDAVIDWDYYPY